VFLFLVLRPTLFHLWWQGFFLAIYVSLWDALLHHLHVRLYTSDKNFITSFSAAAAVEVHNYENITGSQKVHISFQTTACLEDDSIIIIIIIIIIIPSPHLTSQN
jgi:hypothetical protein